MGYQDRAATESGKTVNDCIIRLERLAYLPAVTLGKMTFSHVDDVLYTVERPWLGNRAFESCIPTGVYRVGRYSSQKYNDHFIVLGVPERSQILLHEANRASDVQGCIGIGSKLMQNSFGVLNSQDAMRRLREILQKADIIQLHITQYMPEYP